MASVSKIQYEQKIMEKKSLQNMSEIEGNVVQSVYDTQMFIILNKRTLKIGAACTKGG